MYLIQVSFYLFCILHTSTMKFYLKIKIIILQLGEQWKMKNNEQQKKKNIFSSVFGQVITIKTNTYAFTLLLFSHLAHNK